MFSFVGSYEVQFQEFFVLPSTWRKLFNIDKAKTHNLRIRVSKRRAPYLGYKTWSLLRAGALLISLLYLQDSSFFYPVVFIWLHTRQGRDWMETLDIRACWQANKCDLYEQEYSRTFIIISPCRMMEHYYYWINFSSTHT